MLKSKLCFSVLSFLAALLFASACSSGSYAPPTPDYWPTSGWESSTPERQGMDSEMLSQMYEAIEDEAVNLHSLVIIRNGYIVSEAYFHPYSKETLHDIASVTKSVSATLLGIAVQRGLIKNVDQTVLGFYPDRYVENRDADKEALTLEHLLTLETGFDCDLGMTEAEMQQSGNWAAYLLNLPMAGEPGESWYYCSPATHLISVILENATGMRTNEFANSRLFGPLGIQAVQPQQWAADPQGVSRGDLGLFLTPRDMAKVGLLYLQDGIWDGTRLLPGEWVSAATADQADKGDGTGYGYLWTTYPGQSHYAALGLGGQQLHVFPDRNMIVAVTAALPAYAESDEINTLLNDYILPAARSDGPLPENPEAYDRLGSLQQLAVSPISSRSPLPGMVQEISGRTYLFDENPMGWSSLRLTFTKGSESALASLNDAPEFAVGLDGRYRINPMAEGPPIALRARWIDDSTLVIEQRNIGTIEELDITVTFQGDQMTVHVVDSIFGNLDVEVLAEARK